MTNCRCLKLHVIQRLLVDIILPLERSRRYCPFQQNTPQIIGLETRLLQKRKITQFLPRLKTSPWYFTRCSYFKNSPVMPSLQLFLFLWAHWVDILWWCLHCKMSNSWYQYNLKLMYYVKIFKDETVSTFLSAIEIYICSYQRKYCNWQLFSLPL